MFYRHNKNPGSLAVLFFALMLLGIAATLFSGDDNERQYRIAKDKGDILRQFSLAESLIRQSPDDIELTYGQLDMAKSSYEKLRQNHYVFASAHRLKDAKVLIKFAPNSIMAQDALRRAEDEIRRMRQLKEKFVAVRRLETGFETGFYRHPDHIEVFDTNAKLPDYLEHLPNELFMGAFYQAVADKPLNDFQLRRMLSHQTEVLDALVPLKKELNVLAAQPGLTEEAQQMKQCVGRLTEFHKQTMQYMLSALVKEGISHAQSEYAELIKIADKPNEQNISSNRDNALTALAYQQWQWYNKTYLEPANQMYRAMTRYPSDQAHMQALLAQAEPYGKLAYQYFWSGDDVSRFVGQGPLRQKEADKIIAVLNEAPKQDLASLEKVYAGLMAQ